jgi:hypothetical protein
MSSIRLIWRLRPPDRSIDATPSTVSNPRRTTLSATSVISRIGRSPYSASVTTGSESGSALRTVGGKAFTGSCRCAPDTFSRTSSTASPISFSRMNVITMNPPFSLVMQRSSSMPEIDDTASSSGSTICDTTSSGLAPGRR